MAVGSTAPVGERCGGSPQPAAWPAASALGRRSASGWPISAAARALDRRGGAPWAGAGRRSERVTLDHEPHEAPPGAGRRGDPGACLLAAAPRRVRDEPCGRARARQRPPLALRAHALPAR
eukprot:5353636-Prymnesium_polylepis.1